MERSRKPRKVWFSAGAMLIALSACSGSDDGEPVAVAAEGSANETMTPTPEHARQVLVVRNGDIFDGTGGPVIRAGAVVVEDGLIVAVGPESQIEVPDAAEVIDARGGTIMPGLVDTHVHHLEQLVVDAGELRERKADFYLTSPLRSGVTTYRDLGSSYGDSTSIAELRSAIDRLGVAAPRVVLAGPFIAHPDSQALDRFGAQGTGVADAGSAESLTVQLLDAGVDQIKIMVEQTDFSRPNVSTPSLDGPQITSITDAAHGLDAWVVAHVSDADEAVLALSHGVDELTHWPGDEPLPDEVITWLATDGVPVGTTFAVQQAAEGDLRRLLDAGGTVVVSTDAPGATSPGAIALELQRMVDAGMTPTETLVAATRDGARAVGLGEVIGTLEVGRGADIVVVAGDPMADIGAINDVTHVVVRGEVAFANDD